MKAQRLEPGRVIDGFTLEEHLHTGGMATIWRVSRPDIELPVILKAPLIMDGSEPGAIVGFEMEQMIMPRLSGVHVPRCFGVGDFATEPYIVMERIAGDSLLPRFKEAPIPFEEIADKGARVATALDDLHRQHVLHLDVKPSNIMFRETGEAVMIDFGLSRHAHLPDLMAEEFRIPYGTMPYLSPEQIVGNRTDPRSDQFALGCLFYHLATGERAFGDPQSMRGLRRRLWRDAHPPIYWRKDIPAWLQEIILRMIEVDPDRRFPTMSQVAFALQHPDSVTLTDRATRKSRDGLFTVLGRRFGPRPRSLAAPGVEVSAAAGAAAPRQAPIVVAAVDLSAGMEALAEAVRDMAARVLTTMPDARLACVNVLKTALMATDEGLDSEGRSVHVNRLVELKHWARPLGLGEDRLSFHVLEATDAAEALIDFASVNHADQIVLGARGASSLRRYLGSVSAQVVAEAPCTVTVVRVRSRPGERAATMAENAIPA